MKLANDAITAHIGPGHLQLDITRANDTHYITMSATFWYDNMMAPFVRVSRVSRKTECFDDIGHWHATLPDKLVNLQWWLKQELYEYMYGIKS